MDFDVQLPSNPTERRRMQNRLAQRKFRQRKKHTTASAQNGVSFTSPVPPGNPRDHAATNAAFSDINPTAIESLLSSSSDHRPQLDSPDINALANIIYVPGDLSSSALHIPLPQTTHGPSTNSSVSNGVEQMPLSHISTPVPSIQLESCLTQLPPAKPSPIHDTLFDLITSAQSDKGWLSTLHIAAQKGHDRIIAVLLKQGNMDPNKQDSDGRTPLVHAVVEGHEPVVKLLLEHGARIGIPDCDGRSAVHWAVLHRREDILRVLMTHRAEHEPDVDINAYDNYDWTPLHMAVNRGVESVVVLLIECGANMDAMAKKCPFSGTVMPLIDLGP
ncbi:hypothetical protein P175DRAFT_0498835 [Aspergillus ochraceoroseus IBT 24754]|uniref:BZIP domain-containing protein n=3 Tax=Aspergillus subgen. Nidulantes TaxID=2720870 RepID=A0A0F8U5L0_9EURO|nr:uncharacterized protein P175DRAFT_0498835 [Aspergillus ochraceoroseus IBT 24754]KKK14868.1 hypothetical protein ARAM_002836 [Aspergillus rambellii]KKK21128.1 hypothetical protein AOCH_002930 [Aspergillus ochraceoroseus]PTU22300.1 hypothetical protein P175DRAFT_0498835 [Aspergillus ochraceoroseus IBT 24754]